MIAGSLDLEVKVGSTAESMAWEVGIKMTETLESSRALYNSEYNKDISSVIQ